MVLSDADIIERIGQDELIIEPYEEDNVEPASMDLRLGEGFKRVVQTDKWRTIDTHSPQDTDAYDCIESETSVRIEPEDFVLATTKERVEIPDDMVAHVLGRSSLGRLGISIHQTAGYIDPGFDGQITLELSNHGPAPVVLHSDDRICQIVFEELSSPALHPYGHEGSQYQHQSGATESGMDFE
jgi:dCTP deaminase